MNSSDLTPKQWWEFHRRLLIQLSLELNQPLVYLRGLDDTMSVGYVKATGEVIILITYPLPSLSEKVNGTK
jgi:hypothetical protein